MTNRESEKAWVTQIYGREQNPNNTSKKVGATIYHSIFLHNPIGDLKILAGIRRNLEKLMTPEDIKLVENEHRQMERHRLK